MFKCISLWIHQLKSRCSRSIKGKLHTVQKFFRPSAKKGKLELNSTLIKVKKNNRSQLRYLGNTRAYSRQHRAASANSNLSISLVRPIYNSSSNSICFTPTIEQFKLGTIKGFRDSGIHRMHFKWREHKSRVEIRGASQNGIEWTQMISVTKLDNLHIYGNLYDSNENENKYRGQNQIWCTSDGKELQIHILQ